MDLALLESLNAEYRQRPLVPAPPAYDPTSVEARGRWRIESAHAQLDLTRARTLELGCGLGYEVWLVGHRYDADAWGVDVTERSSWRQLADSRTHYVCADLAGEHPFAEESFDRIVSWNVLEHVVHPYRVLSEVLRILRPGGLAGISANLYRGPKASHRYREIHFPFLHLLFSDDVIREFRARRVGKAEGAAWVNRLTWAQYEDYFREIGFVIRALRFDETPLDEPFYERFSEILARYPRWDLTHDFFHVILEKPAAG